MDENEKNNCFTEFARISEQIAETPDSPVTYMRLMGDFFDKIWKNGYEKGVEINKEISKLN